MITLQKYTDSYRSKWNKFIQESKNGLFFFDRTYMEYHKDRFKDHSLIFLKGDEIVAALPSSENGNTIISHGGLTFGSLITSYSIKTVDVLNIFDEIVKYYKELGFKTIIYKCIPYIFNKYPSQEDEYALFRTNAKLIRRDVSSVILISEKIDYNENKKRLVKKCLKNNISISKTEDFAEYWRLLEKTLLKYNTKPVHNLDEITSLRKQFPHNILLYEARDGNALLSGTVIFDFGNVVHTQYLATSDEGRKLGGLDFINHFLINEVFANRKYYSFGISTENMGRYLNEGLIQQKENMGGRAVTLDFYEINLEND